MPATKKSKPKIPKQIAEEIRSREDEALIKGWSYRDLWESRAWVIEGNRNRPGLAAVLHSGDKIGEITERFIEVISDSGRVGYFFHPDRVHPWHKGSGGSAV